MSLLPGGCNDIFLRHHRIMGQGDSARDFGSSESMKNAGILNVFPIFHTARLGQKIRRSPQRPLCGDALNSFQRSGAVLRQQQIRDDIVADQIPLGGQHPAARIGLGGVEQPALLFQHLLQRVKGQQEGLLILSLIHI